MPRTKYEFPEDRLFITPQYLRLRYGTFDPNVFARWRNQDKVTKLANRFYRNRVLPKISEDDLYVAAGQLYAPSYISLHTALSHYGLIPEYTVQMISITTRKPWRHRADHVTYVYRHVKPTFYFGYEAVHWRNAAYKIATPEKAILDLAYLETLFSDEDWLYEMRFDHWELADMDWNRMDRYLAITNSPTLTKRIDLLRKVYEL